MSINRVGQLVAPQPSDAKRRRQQDKLLDLLLSAGVSRSIQEHRQKHPGEQCYVTVLDTQECIVQDLLRWVNPQLLEALPDGVGVLLPLPSVVLMVNQQVMQMGAAEGGKRPDMGLWVQVLPRSLGIHVATFLAKDEPAMQALCDRLQDDVIVVGLACGGMWLEPLCAPKAGALAAAERGRRQDRARRAGR